MREQGPELRTITGKVVGMIVLSGREVPVRGSGLETWRTIRYALRDWGKTVPLCLVLFVMSVPPAVILFLIMVAAATISPVSSR